ncbi:menaquinone biosynthesis methyltransferase ubiE [Trifolium pratense]|uniref:Menaquinone biosynthesis methyltransferase ubiE n=1 Tax=Trifolium pratense TaxID=57577 RepID=A0A2K3KQB0_TRIPR|nr:menaquinone biosynthesis methyltransferase ubiE [Trifolium pratense]
MALSSPLQNLSSLINPHGIATATAQTPTRRHLAIQAAASSSDTTTPPFKLAVMDKET